MNIYPLCTAVLVALTMLGSQASADIISSDAAPSIDVLYDAFLGSAINNTLATGPINPVLARGAEFSIGSAGQDFDILGLTIQSAFDRIPFAPDNQFTVAFYEGVLDPLFPAGSLQDPFHLDGFGLNLIGFDFFDAISITGDAPDGQVGMDDYVTFEFSNTFQVPGGTPLTAVVSNNNFSFPLRIGIDNGGGGLVIRPNQLFRPDNVDFNFSVSGTAVVPEPTSLAVLGLGVIGVMARRRR